jgi:hypothetical protein
MPEFGFHGFVRGFCVVITGSTGFLKDLGAKVAPSMAE